MTTSRRKRYAAIATACLMTIGTAACGGGDGDSSGSGEAGTTVTVGVIGPLSGPLSTFGIEQERGIDLAAKAVKEDFGITMKVESEDDGAEPEKAATEIQRLLNEKNVDVFIGPSLSGSAFQVAPIIQKVGRPWLTPAAADGLLDVTSGTNWGFRFQHSTTEQVGGIRDQLFAGDNKPGVIVTADAYGQTVLAAVEALSEETGQDLVDAESVQTGSQDLSTTARKLQAAGVDTIYLAVTNGADMATLTRAFRQLDYAPKIIATTNITTGGFFDIAEPAQWETIVVSDCRNYEDPSLMGVMDAYDAAYGQEPDSRILVATAYLEAYTYAKIIHDSGADPHDFDAVRDAIENVESIDAWGEVYEKPFSDSDRDLYEADPHRWFLYSLDESGEFIAQGRAG